MSALQGVKAYVDMVRVITFPQADPVDISRDLPNIICLKKDSPHTVSQHSHFLPFMSKIKPIKSDQNLVFHSTFWTIVQKFFLSFFHWFFHTKVKVPDFCPCEVPTTEVSQELGKSSYRGTAQKLAEVPPAVPLMFKSFLTYSFTFYFNQEESGRHILLIS